MRVSVIIPVHNTERYVAESIDSVLAQRRPADEVIVVDDGSTDRTPAVLAQFGSRITVLRQRHLGVSAALNAGLARATGDHLAFNDADDLWLPDKLTLQCELLAGEPGLEAAFGMVKQFVSPDWDGGRDIAVPDHDQAGTSRPTMLIRRDAFDRIGLFDTSVQVEFIDWFARAQLQGLRTELVPQVLLLRRLHATNSGRLHGASHRRQNLQVLKRMLDARRGNPTA
jgi:glycosyltransferase involved in cell wall biosynthesis